MGGSSGGGDGDNEVGAEGFMCLAVYV